MGIMQLWGGHDTDDDMARAKLDTAKIDSWVRQLKLALKDADAFKAICNSLAAEKGVSSGEAIEIAYKFTGMRAKSKKAAIASIGQERLRASHAKAKGESAAKTRTW